MRRSSGYGISANSCWVFRICSGSCSGREAEEEVDSVTAAPVSNYAEAEHTVTVVLNPLLVRTVPGSAT